MGIFDSIDKKIESHETGIRVSDLLDLPRSLRTIMNRVIRDKEVTVETVAEHLGESPEKAQEMLETLIEKGYLRVDKREGVAVYRVEFGRTHPKDIPGSIWSALEGKVKD